ncbi:2-oxoadipate dioxygenase/decarboxylase family protein [Sphingomonas canadensis]|uniref:2-oxoadipate dioxygenase/decarboxylase n=1 Tax=Sphingomonas canadensis TaxID=1219257 RepID=A0ABW3H906_9SPHN|nr:DUF1338 family protein [Sphingomonas canadensis]MCW3837655.1 DUF1338 family protein [Sphingomonas canadensis]
MTDAHANNLHRLIAACVGADRARALLEMLRIDPAFGEARPTVSRAEMAMALNALLFGDLLERVPSGAAYVHRVIDAGGRIAFDHGALRTIRFPSGPTGALPGGIDAFTRILAPLGYAHARAYPLPALRMTGHAWCHRDLPEAIPQFFVSELHVDRFSEGFQQSAARVFGASRDPLDGAALEVLAAFEGGAQVPFALAVSVLPTLAAAFDRQHEPCALADYEALLSESAEAAWIATEGNAFNHATDRVADVDALSAELRAAGMPIKDKVELSAGGRVRQTALRADPVLRRFRHEGDMVSRSVPGSFYEFITRDVDPATGSLDLAFDSSNAQGIFAMTKAA